MITIIYRNLVIAAPNIQENNWNIIDEVSNNSTESEIIMRAKRDPVTMSMVGLSIGKWVAGVVGLAIAMTGAGVSAVVVDHHLREESEIAREIRQEKKIKRRKLGCKENNFGCIENVCWSNCGPRIKSGDWCLTTKDETAYGNSTLTSNTTQPTITYKNNGTAPTATCVQDSDCDPCWRCAGGCLLED